MDQVKVDPTFNGQLHWEIDAQSMATDIEAAGIESDMLATRAEWPPKEKEIVTELSVLLSCTRSVEIIGTKKPSAAVLEMVKVLMNRPGPSELVAWRLKLPYKLRDAWESAWASGQDLFEVSAEPSV